MKKVYTFIIAIAATYAMLTLPACDGLLCKQGSGKMVTEDREVHGFSKIDISGSFKVVIKQDSVESLTITADDNLMKYIKSDVDDDKLHIRSKGSLCNSGKFTLTISLRDVSEIKTSGAVDVTSNGKINAKDVKLDMSGATIMTLDLNANNVKTSGSGLTELNLTGQASTHYVDLSGAGHLNALNFVVAKYDIETSGVSDCKINVLNRLDMSSSGASNVEYRGNPATINNSKSGASTLKKVD